MAWPTKAEELPGGVQNDTDGETGLPNPAEYAKTGGTDPEGEGDHARRHNELSDAVNRTWTELGVNPSGSQADVAARLDAIGLTLATNTEGLATAAAAIKAEAARAEAAEASKAALVHSHPQYDPFDALPYILPMGLWPFTTIEPTIKRAYLTRFTVGRKRLFKVVRFPQPLAGTGEDEIDCGIYVVNGAKLERVASSGAVKSATNVSNVKVLELTATATCEPGSVYFVGMSWKTRTGAPTVAAYNNNGGFYGDAGGAGTLANRLMIFKAETFPLPATIEGPFTSTPTAFLLPSES